jgi:murein DD-endopeptidase MepM/ murein hydrolase activator NlpD
MDLTPGMRRRTRTRTAMFAAALLAGCASAGVAQGDGGLTPPAPPTIKDVTCIEGCLDVRSVAEGGRAELSGKSLTSIETVRLAGTAEDVRAKVTSDKTVEFTVPEGAETGKPVAIDGSGNRYRSPVELDVKPGSRLVDPGDFTVRETRATPHKSYFAGEKRSRVEYLFEADGPTDIRVDVLRKDKIVDTFVEKDQEPFTQQTVTWKGLTDSGKVAPNGKYKFEVAPLSGGAGGKAAFQYYDHRFPLPAKHTYGDGLGAGRNHEGQDVLAKCGKPIVAARGGKVQTVQYHSAAGYYVVIDGAKTGVDYVYMHLNKHGLPKKGEKIKTGEQIGSNDMTGDATACHLHFEMWSAPGWYEGGHVMDPTPSLKKWDDWS